MKIKLFFCFGVLLILLSLPFLPLKDEGEIYDKTLRLHVIANSDSEYDQELKLKVRDGVLEKAKELSEQCLDKADAERVYGANLFVFKETAEHTLRENGCDMDVTVTLGEEYYPEREYEELRLPAGRYTSLKVNIGAAEGHNWWCVLFPPLCVKSAAAEEELAMTGFTPNQIRVLTDSETPRYVIKFRILEIFEELKYRLAGK